RIALLYEDRAHLIAEGVTDVLQPHITHRYSNRLQDAYNLAVEIRNEQIDVVIVATFEGDAQYFWQQLRRADANIAAWIQVGSQLDDRCDSFAAISIGAAGEVDPAYRALTAGAVYERYRELSAGLFGAVSERADLAASGLLMLLTYVLDADEVPTTSEAMRDAVLSSEA